MKFKSIFFSVFLIFAFAKAVSGQIKTPPTHTTITPELAARVDSIFMDTDKADHPGAALGIFKYGIHSCSKFWSNFSVCGRCFDLS